MPSEKCPASPKGEHCWHGDPKPDYSRPAPYRHYCCWCGEEYFEKGFADGEVPSHGQCRDGTCKETG